jgi:RNA polymerase sigma-70 factor (ECF subfamily)
MPKLLQTSRDNEERTGPAEGRSMTLSERVTQAYEATRDDVYRYLLTFGMPPDHAQEVTQEVYLRMFVSLKHGEDILNPRAWAFRVAHNLGLNRKTREKPVVPVDSALEAVLPSGEASAERVLLERERQARLAKALETLSPQQRQCLHLRAEGLRYREIAETVGVSISTVSEFLGRALARLRKAVHD